TEIEWETAARLGQPSPSSLADSASLSASPSPTPSANSGLANHGAALCCGEDASDGWARSASVHDLADDALGLAGMAGNLAEWTDSPYSPTLVGAHPDERADDDLPLVVIRGGSFLHPPEMLRPTARQAMPPGLRSELIGFRCAWDGPRPG
ncbi:MAG: formylglycine-generating enzyme family protein, partial [Holophagales bacterium]|nr:formylglycine-generating enzyme family protein [Holophagales bacterium]